MHKFQLSIVSGSILLCAIATSLVTPGTANATYVSEYTGVWRSGKDPYYLWTGASWKSFVDKWKELSKDELRLVDIERHVENGKAKYTGVWRGGKGGHYLWKTTGWDNFTKKWSQLAKQNLRLIDIETFVENGKQSYLGVWRSGKDGYALWAAPSWSKFTDKWKELSDDGQRLIDIEAYTAGGATKYLGVFRAGSGGHYLWKADNWQAFTSKWKELSKQRLRLIDIERFAEGGRFKYAGVFRKGGGGHILWRSGPEAFFDKWAEAGAKDLRLIDVELTIAGGKPVTQVSSGGKPVVTRDCAKVGPFRFSGKRIKGILYGVDYSREETSDDIIVESAVVKLVGGVCVKKGKVEYTLHYRSTAHRPVPMVETLTAGQCRCYWTNRAKGWPFEYKVRSTVKVQSSSAQYTHELSVCITPWRRRCQVKTWEGWK